MHFVCLLRGKLKTLPGFTKESGRIPPLRICGFRMIFLIINMQAPLMGLSLGGPVHAVVGCGAIFILRGNSYNFWVHHSWWTPIPLYSMQSLFPYHTVSRPPFQHRNLSRLIEIGLPDFEMKYTIFHPTIDAHDVKTQPCTF